MTVHAFLAQFEPADVTITVYSPGPATDVVERLAAHRIDVSQRTLPAPVGDAFAVVRKNGTFDGVLPLDAVRTFLSASPDDRGVGEGPESDPDRQRLRSSLANTLFSSLTRSQLLATSREFEDRAYRLGAGTLRVSFQSLSTFRTQHDRYETLAGDTDLEIHVYGQADRDPPEIPGVTVHSLGRDCLADVWLLAFDAAGDEYNKCALVAEETDPGQYRGFWTYDPTLVDEILAAVAAVDA